MSMTTTTQHALAPAPAAHDLGSMMQFANMMSRGRLMPKHLQDSPGDCLMVVELAVRLGMSPFAVAQTTSVIQGKIMMEGKLVSAAVNSCGLLEGRLDYEMTGEGDARTIKVTGRIRGETKQREVTVHLKDVRTSNEMWKKQPDQQLVYSGNRIWARRHAPEVMLGVYTPEEFDQQTAHGVPIVAEVVQTETRRDTPHDPVTGEIAPKRATWSEKLDELERDLNACRSADEVDAVLAEDRVQKMRDHAQNGAKKRLEDMITKAQYRDFTNVPDFTAPEQPDAA